MSFISVFSIPVTHYHNRIFVLMYYKRATIWEKVIFTSSIDIKVIEPLSDMPMFYIKYLTMHKVHMHAGALRQLLYGRAYVREIIHSLKLVDYPPVHTHKPYNNLHLLLSNILVIF